MYWLYRTDIHVWRNQYVQALLQTPNKTEPKQNDCGFGFASPEQDAPFGVDLQLCYAVSSRHTHPDWYADSHGFNLCSERLVELLQEFEVLAEYFPVTMVDQHGSELPKLKYYVFHCLEGVLNAMDEEKSGWTGDWQVGIPKLVVNLEQFSNRPMFTCNKLYVKLMRQDLKDAIRERNITGLGFLAPARYHCGEYGFAPNYDE